MEKQHKQSFVGPCCSLPGSSIWNFYAKGRVIFEQLIFYGCGRGSGTAAGRGDSTIYRVCTVSQAICLDSSPQNGKGNAIVPILKVKKLRLNKFP